MGQLPDHDTSETWNFFGQPKWLPWMEGCIPHLKTLLNFKF